MKKVSILVGIIIIIVAIIIIFGGVFAYQKYLSPKTQNQNAPLKPFAYGTLDNYFTGQEMITYPLIFDDIKILSDQNLINFGPQEFEGFQIFMSAAKSTRKDADNLKSNLINMSGDVSEGQKRTPNGYVGELLSEDLKAHPSPSGQNCMVAYMYFIPLSNSDNDLVITVDFSQPEWGTKPGFRCTIFDNQNYTYLKAMVDHVIDNIQPSS